MKRYSVQEKILRFTRSILLYAFILSFSDLRAAEDWRLEFLKAAEMKTDTESLRKLNASHQKTPEDLQKMIDLLGADKHAVRNAAQEDISRMGKDVLPLLQKLPAPQDPEALLRFRAIQDQLSRAEGWDSQQLVRMAATGIVFERDNPGKIHPSRQMFVEFFRQPADSLRKGYRRMTLLSTNGLDGRVAEEMLRLSGKRPQGEGDQRLCISAQEATGEKQFPDRFRIDVKIGGMAGGEGAYHVGVAVGKVRVLFHPALETGAFRFENVDSHEQLTSNDDMRFTPKAGSLVDMRIDVQRLAKGTVELAVEISSDKEVYRMSETFDADQIGTFDQVSLDRSGRDGGDGIFRNLVMQFALP